jgi:hypothetical protein
MAGSRSTCRGSSPITLVSYALSEKHAPIMRELHQGKNLTYVLLGSPLSV